MEKKNIYVVVKSNNFDLSRQVSRILSDALIVRGVDHRVAGKGETLLFKATDDQATTTASNVRGIVFTEHSLMIKATTDDPQKVSSVVRPPVGDNAVSYQHNLNISIVGEVGVGKTTMRTLCEKAINDHFETELPVIDFNLDNFKDYPAGDLKEYLASSERMDGFRQKVVVNIIPQTMTLSQIIDS